MKTTTQPTEITKQFALANLATLKWARACECEHRGIRISRVETLEDIESQVIMHWCNGTNPGSLLITYLIDAAIPTDHCTCEAQNLAQEARQATNYLRFGGHRK